MGSLFPQPAFLLCSYAEQEAIFLEIISDLLFILYTIMRKIVVVMLYKDCKLYTSIFNNDYKIIHYDLQQTPIPKIENSMVKEQQKLTKEVIELQNKLDNATLQLVESNNKIEAQNNHILELKNQLNETGIDKAKHKISEIIVGALAVVLISVILYFIAKFLGISL